MNSRKEIKRLSKRLETVITVNSILLQFHDIPILAKLNEEIKKDLRKLQKNENQVQKSK